MCSLKERSRSWPMVAFALSFFGFAGVMPLFGEAPDPLSWSFIAIAAYQPAFMEEFFFASFFKEKLNEPWVKTGLGSIAVSYLV